MKKNNKGAALIIVIVIIAIIMIFTFSLLLISTTFYLTENNKLYNIRSTEASITLSKVLEEEVQDEESTLYQYIRYNLVQNDTWPYYDPTFSGHQKEDAFRYFDLTTKENIPGYPNKVQLVIYWELPDEHDNNLDKEDAILPSEIINKNGIKLNVEINCETGDEMYSITNKYILNVSTFSEEDAEEFNLLKQNSLDSSLNPFGFDLFQDIETSEKWEWKLDSVN